MTDLRFDRFYNYAELTAILEDFASSFGPLCTIDSIGTSHEGRDIWLAMLTNSDTGPHDEKPALWLDANIHSVEVTGCTAALHLIHKLLTGYAENQDVTRALDTRTFYIVPRLNPDGADIALSDKPLYVRSSVRPYPRTDHLDGLHEEDVYGDGRILLMRVEDPDGSWKAHEGDPRLMVPRGPTEFADDGTFYRLLPEGTIRNFDGTSIRVAEPLEGLDLNRNFPMEWTTENEQKGAGPYPASEPEDAPSSRRFSIAPTSPGTSRTTRSPECISAPTPVTMTTTSHPPIWRFSSSSATRRPRSPAIPPYPCSTTSNTRPSKSSKAARTTGPTSISGCSHGRPSFGVHNAKPDSRTTTTSSG